MVLCLQQSKWYYYLHRFSVSEVRAHFSGGDGIDISSGEVAVDNTVVRTSGPQTVAGAKTFSADVVTVT